MSRTLERQMSDFLTTTSIDMPGGRARSLHQLVREIADYIKYGVYLGMRRTRAERWADDPNVEERLLVRAIEDGMRGHIHVGGRRYRLVAGADIAGVPDRSSHEVVRHDEARRVLDELAQQHAAQVALAQNLKKASAKLSPDWRPPLRPKGIVLLRRLASRPVASGKPTPVLTPSQMRAMMKKQPGIITFLEVPEYIASGSETVSLRYGFDDPDGRLTDVVLEIFTDDDRASRLWSRKVPREHVAAGKGSLDWNGKLDISDGEFPDGFAAHAWRRSVPDVLRHHPPRLLRHLLAAPARRQRRSPQTQWARPMNGSHVQETHLPCCRGILVLGCGWLRTLAGETKHV